ncbi:hypothetical protein BJY52DRAFT_558623 [Lactarius psammicola]|nr:hypothetical protein BJY52DRAFT_558623 [Lactarius psammicola]
MKDIGDKVDIVINHEKEAKMVIRQTANSIDDIKWSQVRRSLRRWVAPPDPSTNHNIACNAHHEGTAGWFFQGSIFGEWKSIGSLLLIYGKPGSGKTILCSSIIQDIVILRDVGLASVVYFYFYFRDLDKQNRRNLLSSLLIQLSARPAPCCDILSCLYSAHENGERTPNDDVLILCLKDMLMILGQ